MTWKNVYWVPEMGTISLFSSIVLDKKGFSMTCQNGAMILSKNGKNVFKEIRNGNNFVPLMKVMVPRRQAFQAQLQNFEIWHKRLGHASDDAIHVMEKNKLVNGLKVASYKRHP